MLSDLDINSLAKAAHLQIRPEDLDDLNIGLNALLDALNRVPDSILQGIEPLSTTEGVKDDKQE